MDEPYYTAAEAAELLGLTYQQTILRLRKGVIKGQKIGWSWVIFKKDLPEVPNENN